MRESVAEQYSSESSTDSSREKGKTHWEKETILVNANDKALKWIEMMTERLSKYLVCESYYIIFIQNLIHWKMVGWWQEAEGIVPSAVHKRGQDSSWLCQRFFLGGGGATKLPLPSKGNNIIWHLWIISPKTKEFISGITFGEHQSEGRFWEGWEIRGMGLFNIYALDSVLLIGLNWANRPKNPLGYGVFASLNKYLLSLVKFINSSCMHPHTVYKPNHQELPADW